MDEVLTNPKYRIPLLATLFVAYIALPGITTGCVYAALNTGIRSNNDMLVSRTTGQPIQTASADYVVQNGILVQRSADSALKLTAGSTREAVVAPPPIRMPTFAAEVASVSSTMSIQQLSALTSISLASASGGAIKTNIQGFAVVPESDAPGGKYVIFDTSAGQFVLRGTQFTPVEAQINGTELVQKVFPGSARRYILLGGGYTNDCVSNCCVAPYNTGVPAGWG